MKNLDSKVWKNIIILAVIIIIMSALARTLSGSETLADYASKHPEEQTVISEEAK